MMFNKFRPITLPVRVAILGSCVTRDIFNRQFNPGYKHLFECVALSNQNSAITLMGEPFQYYGSDGDPIEDAVWGEISAEAERSFLGELLEKQPDLLLIDTFADVHFGIAIDELKRPMTSNRWKFLTTNWYRKNSWQHLAPDDPKYMPLWEESNLRFIRYIRECLPNTRLLFHDVRNTIQYRGSDGFIKKFPDSDSLSKQNSLWSRYAEWYERQGIELITAFDAETYSFEGHPWGPFVVHYELRYHQEFLAKLAAWVVRTNQHPVKTRKIISRIFND